MSGGIIANNFWETFIQRGAITKHRVAGQFYNISN